MVDGEVASMGTVKVVEKLPAKSAVTVATVADKYVTVMVEEAGYPVPVTTKVLPARLSTGSTVSARPGIVSVAAP